MLEIRIVAPAGIDAQIEEDPYEKRIVLRPFITPVRVISGSGTLHHAGVLPSGLLLTAEGCQKDQMRDQGGNPTYEVLTGPPDSARMRSFTECAVCSQKPIAEQPLSPE